MWLVSEGGKVPAVGGTKGAFCIILEPPINARAFPYLLENSKHVRPHKTGLNLNMM